MSSDPQAVLITGTFGVGKTTVVEEMAEILERDGARFAALDLDWLSWAWPGTADDGDAEHRLMLEHLGLIVGNLRRRGNDRFVLAYAVRTLEAWRDIRSTLSMPTRLVALTLPLDEIRRRVAADPTAGRVDDLRRSEAWLADVDAPPPGPDLEIANDRAVHEVAEAILAWLGWRKPGVG
jgi:energy-coupling factor transporter ATP-binding protein EcfA2